MGNSYAKTNPTTIKIKVSKKYLKTLYYFDHYKYWKPQQPHYFLKQSLLKECKLAIYLQFPLREEQEFSDLFFLKSAGVYSLPVLLSKPELVAIYLPHCIKLYLIEPGKTIEIDLNTMDKDDNPYHYEQDMMPSINKDWLASNRSYIAKMDSSSYNTFLYTQLQEKEQRLKLEITDTTTKNFKEQSFIIRLRWALDYINFAYYKRLTEPIETFNKVSNNYLVPLESLLYSIENTNYLSTDLLLELIEKYKLLRKVNFDTRLLTKYVFSELDIHESYFKPYSFGLHCKFGYKWSDLWVIEPNFDFADKFNGSYAIVTINGLQGVIDKYGDFVVKPIFESLEWIEHHNLLTYKKNKLKGLLSVSGKILTDCTFEYFEPIGNYLFIYRKNGLAGLMNKEGKILIEPQYNYLSRFENEYWEAAVYQLQLYKKENPLIPFNIDSTTNANRKKQIERSRRYPYRVAAEEQIILIAEDPQLNKVGILDTNGHVVFPFIYNSLTSDGTPFVKCTSIDSNIYKFDYYNKKQKNYQYRTGIIDCNGQVIVPFDFQTIVERKLNNTSFFLVSKTTLSKINNQWISYNNTRSLLYDVKGKVIYNDSIYVNRSNHLGDKSSILNGYSKDDKPIKSLLIYKANNTLYLLKDDTANTIIDSFDTFKYFNESKIKIGKNGKYAAMDNGFNYLSPFLYDDIVSWDDYPLVIQQKKLFVLNNKGKPLNKEGYDEMRPFVNNMYEARMDPYICILDSHFELLFKLKAQAVFVERNDVFKASINTINLLENGLIVQQGQYLYKPSCCGDSICYTQIVPGKVVFIECFSGMSFLLNEQGLILHSLPSAYNDYDNYRAKKDIFIDIDKILIKDGSYITKLTIISKDEHHQTVYGYLSPIYDKQSPIKKLLIPNGRHRNIELNFHNIQYYILRTQRGKVGIVDTNFNILLDTIYDNIIKRANGNISAYMGHNFNPKQHNYRQQTVFIFNAQLELIATLPNIFDVTFVKDNIISVAFKKDSSNVYKIDKQAIIPLNAEDISFDNKENVCWVKKKGLWYLCDTLLGLLNKQGFKSGGYVNFELGIAQINEGIMLKTGAFIPTGNYQSQPLDIDIRKLLFKDVDSNITLNLERKENYTSKSIKNFSDIHFSKSAYYSDKSNKEYFKQLDLANDKRYPDILLKAINNALIVTQKTYYINIDFFYVANNLFRFQMDGNYEDGRDFRVNYMIINDSLFELNSRLESYKSEFNPNKWDAFNIYFYTKMHNLKSLEERAHSCPIPQQIIYHYEPQMELTQDSVYFIAKPKSSDNFFTPFTIGFSNKEIKPYLNERLLLYKWIERKRILKD